VPNLYHLGQGFSTCGPWPTTGPGKNFCWTTTWYYWYWVRFARWTFWWKT